MKKETIKEFGKLFYDFAKIGLAVAVLAPLVKGGKFSAYSFVIIIVIIGIGTYLINKGVDDG